MWEAFVTDFKWYLAGFLSFILFVYFLRSVIRIAKRLLFLHKDSKW